MKKRTTKVAYPFVLCLLLFSSSLFSQTVVNDYNQVTAIGGSTATVTSLTGINGIHTLAIGDTVLIIQMQGATINESLTGFGPVSAINNAGKYEINVICGISGNTVAFKLSLVNTYTAPAGQVQIVTHGDGKLLTYTVPAGGVTATKWNGTVGGVVFIKANAITLNGPVTANGKGFRGGVPGGMPGAPGLVCNKNVLIQPGNVYGWTNSGCDGASQTVGVTDFYYPKYKLDIPAPDHSSPPCPATIPADLLQQYMGGWKGEGIAVYITDKETGRGSQANGGGGGQTHNSGGAGGGLFAQGGAGGKQWDIATPAGLVNGGIGGSVGMAPTSLKLFMGGGGGGGHANYPNGHASAGADGGGIVLFRSVTFTYSSNQTISADGNGNLGFIDSDSEGGGGSGGSIYFDVKTMTAGGSAALTVSSKGGRGGDAINGGDCIGTGGGGAGGYILSKAAFPASTVKALTGGISGVVTGVTNTSKPCYGSALSKWGATDGTNGTFLDAQSTYSIPMGSPISCTVPIEIASFTIITYTDKVGIAWSTVSEDNNHYFIIERSIDGINFEEIGVLNGAGTSTLSHNYSFIDKHPYDGLSYYRLKQIDFDGHYSYSLLKPADRNSAYGITDIFPQPAQNDRPISINYLLSRNGKISIKIYDALGKESFSCMVNAMKGLNYSDLSLPHLALGIYYLILYSEDITQCRKIILE